MVRYHKSVMEEHSAQKIAQLAKLNNKLNKIVNDLAVQKEQMYVIENAYLQVREILTSNEDLKALIGSFEILMYGSAVNGLCGS